MSNEDIIKMYKEILENKRGRFPRDFWIDKGNEKAKIIFEYLIKYPDFLKGRKLPVTSATKIKMSNSQKNLSPEKREKNNKRYKRK